MKKINAVSVMALLISVLLIFTGCKNEGGSDIELSQQEEVLTANDKLIALTFDDGPKETSTNKILDILEKNNSRATFFVVGYSIEKNIETIKRAQSIGCEIGNHSDSHKTLTKCSKSELFEQVNNPNDRLAELTGIRPVLFRAPGGAFKNVKEQIGMPLIQWSVDTNDWRAKDSAHPDRTAAEREEKLNEIANDVINNAKKGDIVLMHDIYDFSADLCEKIVPGLIAKGFKLVTVSEMYEIYGVELEEGNVYYSIKFPEAESTAVQASESIGKQ